MTYPSSCFIIIRIKHDEVNPMAIVTQTDKRTGITYAYETKYYWDKTKQQSRATRACVEANGSFTIGSNKTRP